MGYFDSLVTYIKGEELQILWAHTSERLIGSYLDLHFHFGL